MGIQPTRIKDKKMKASVSDVQTTTDIAIATASRMRGPVSANGRSVGLRVRYDSEEDAILSF